MRTRLTLSTALVCATVAWSVPALAGSLDDALLDDARAALEDALPWPEAELAIGDLRLSGGSLKRGAAWTLDVDEDALERGRVRIEVALEDGRSRWLTGDVEILVDAVVADGDIDRGERIGQRWRVERVPLDELPRGWVRDARDASALEARRALDDGDPLSERDLTAPLLVERDQIVTILVVRGGARVSARGVAMEAGKLGEVIRVQPSAAERSVTAVVREVGLVEVP